MFRKARYILSLAALMLFTACQVEREGCTMCLYDFHATVDAAQANSTRAVSSAVHADGRYVNRCIVEIYADNGQLYDRLAVQVENKSVNFQLQLPSNKNFTLLFWADCGNANLSDLYYNTADNLQSVSCKDFAIRNTDMADAFCAVQNIETTQSTVAYSVSLKRPFAQLIVSKATAQATSSIKYQAPSTYNVKTAELGANITYLYNNVPRFDETTVFVDYIFAPAQRSTMNILVDTQNCAAVPVCRNYRTVIEME